MTSAAAAVTEAERKAAAKAAEERARMQADFAARGSVDAERVAAIEKLTAELVEFEREAYKRIDAISSLCSARQRDFYQTRQLSLALALREPTRQPASALVVSDVLQSEITRAQQAEGRNGSNSRQVSVWLQPAARVHALRSRIA